MHNRLKYIDGLRGIAILEVLLFHAYSRWGSIESYTQNQYFVDIFSYGWIGVQLFFAISGYVIYMSVLRSDNFIMFATARYLRLAPAMIFAAILIYGTSFLIPERPGGTTSIVDFLPSLTFIGPGFLSTLTGLDVKSLDEVFWSLYIEVRFYFLVAVTFFILRDKKLIFLLLLYAAWLLLSAAESFQLENFFLIDFLKILNYIGINYYGWFLMGIYAFRFESRRSPGNLVVLILITSSAALTTEIGNWQITFAASLTAMLFLAPIFMISVRKLLSANILLFFGFVSYPLYLVHQNIVTGLAIKLHSIVPTLATYLYPVPFIVLVILIAFMIAKLEPSLKLLFKRFIPIRAFGFDVLKRY